MSPRVSVIVPIYNVEPFLRECADSILAQTFTDLELVLVDDGSPDGCPAICDEYAERDARIRVIHKENGGLSDARNVGLEAAAGEYISFVDGDDMIAPRFLELLLSTGGDVAQCGFCTGGPEELADEVAFESVDPREICRRMCMDSRGDYTVVWNKLWRREVLEEIRFPVGRQHEDEFFTWRAYGQSVACAVTEAPLYYYRQRRDSIMDRGFSPKSLDAVEALTRRAAAWRETGDEELAVLTEAELCHRLRGMMTDLRREMPAEAPAYKAQMRRLYRSVMRSPAAGINKKLSLSLQMLSPGLYTALRGG